MTARSTFHVATTKGGALIALLFCLGGPTSAAPPDVSKAPAGASACLGCHGASETELPSLNKLSESEIESAMDAFRTGAREATLMNRIAKGFTPDETRALAQWLVTQGRAP